MARSPFQARERRARFSPSTAREATRGPRRSSTRRTKGTLEADAGEKEDEGAVGVEDLLEVLDISDDDTGVVNEGNHDDGVEKVGWGVEPGEQDGFNEEAGGGGGGGGGTGEGAGEPPVVDLT